MSNARQKTTNPSRYSWYKVVVVGVGSERVGREGWRGSGGVVWGGWVERGVKGTLRGGSYE